MLTQHRTARRPEFLAGELGNRVVLARQHRRPALLRQVKHDLRGWTLARVIWVADRGSASAANRGTRVWAPVRCVRTESRRGIALD